jgi:phospholipid-binding lipoprotein MlaA
LLDYSFRVGKVRSWNCGHGGREHAMKLYRLGVLGLVGLLAGCVSLEGDDYAVFDPHENANRRSYAVTDAVDRTVLVPVARGYQAVLPDWTERGIANIFQNFRTISSSANGFLQGKPKSGGIDFARLLINSTIGIGGFFDVASRWDLPYQEEDLGQTLAVWGVTKSRYIYVPFLGPSTLRDLPSDLIHSYLPRLLLGDTYNWGVSGFGVVSGRAEVLSASDIRDASALDPYSFTRDAYVQRRKFLIYDGDPPLDDLFDDFGEEDFDDESFENEALESEED